MILIIENVWKIEGVKDKWEDGGGMSIITHNGEIIFWSYELMIVSKMRRRLKDVHKKKKDK